MRPLLANLVTRLVLALLLTSAVCGVARATPPNTILGSVAICDPNSPQSCAAPSGGALPVTGTFSATLGGFAPATTGTPIAVTTGGVTGTLPAGVVVAAFNTGSTNTAFCKLGATATTSDIAIPPQSWFGFTVGASTQLTCITSTSTTSVNMVGGSGLPTGAGGGGGGGGGSSAITTWAGGTLGAMANYGTSPGAVLVPGFNAFITNTPTVAQATAANLNATVVGTGTFATQSTLAAETTKVIGTTRTVGNVGGVLDAIGQNVAAPANWMQMGCQFNTSPATITSTNGSPCQVDNAGNLKVNIAAGASSGAVAQGSTTSGQTGGLTQAAVTTAAPSYTTAQTSPLSLNTAGGLRVDGSAVTQPVSPSTLAAWGLVASTQNGTTPTNGQLAMGQFNTTPTTITSGNVSPFQMDAAGNLLVNIKAGAGSGGTALADEAAFTQGTTSITPIGCLFINSYTALTTGKAGVVSCTSAGSMHTTVDNSLTALVNNADGVAAISAVTSTAGNSPVNSTGYVLNGAGTYDRMRSATQTGSVAVGSSDPCLGANKTNLPISQSGTSSVQLIALSGSTVIYVCSLSLVAAGATTAVITTGTGSACVTGNAAVIGDTTANIANGLSFAANGGMTIGNGAGTIAKGASAGELCMTLGTNVRMSGNLTYVQQ